MEKVSESKAFKLAELQGQAQAHAQEVATLASFLGDAVVDLSHGLSSKLLLDQPFFEGLVVPARKFVLCFKHGITSISEISALSFHLLRGNNNPNNSCEDLLEAHRALLCQQLELEKEAYCKYRDIVRAKVSHNANVVSQASEDVHIRELARLYERSSRIGQLLQSCFLSQFRLKTLCATLLTLGFGTNQALYRPMRNAIQHFHVDREDGYITFFNRRDEPGSDIDFVFCCKEEEFNRHAKFTLTVINQMIIKILSEIIEAIDKELSEKNLQPKFNFILKMGKRE